MNICYIESKSTDAMYNLALEQYVFDELPRNRQYFMLWQNDNAVIIGKHQNTVEEINQEKTEEKEVKVVRRLSGGGAVYHDMGNLNFTFIADADDMETLDMKIFIEPVILVLKEFGINAELTGRNDIVIEGQKFSGNSQYIKNGRVMHHGTILFDSDLNFIQDILNVPKHKIESKGLKSVRSRVTNLKDHIKGEVSLRSFMDAFKMNVFKNAVVEEYTISPDDEERIIQIKKERYSTWEWNFGYSPKYSIIKDEKIEGCGRIEIHMEVTDGRIKGFYSYGDYFGSGDVCELEEILTDNRLAEEDIRQALAEVNIDYYYNNLDIDDFVTLLLK